MDQQSIPRAEVPFQGLFPREETTAEFTFRTLAGTQKINFLVPTHTVKVALARHFGVTAREIVLQPIGDGTGESCVTVLPADAVLSSASARERALAELEETKDWLRHWQRTRLDTDFTCTRHITSTYPGTQTITIEVMPHETIDVALARQLGIDLPSTVWRMLNRLDKVSCVEVFGLMDEPLQDTESV